MSDTVSIIKYPRVIAEGSLFGRPKTLLVIAYLDPVSFADGLFLYGRFFSSAGFIGLCVPSVFSCFPPLEAGSRSGMDQAVTTACFPPCISTAGQRVTLV